MSSPSLPGVVPSRAWFREAAERALAERTATSGSLLIPVYRELVADGDTPVSAFARLGRRPHSFLLESVVGGETWAAYSFIGVTPRALLRVSRGRATIERFVVERSGAATTEERAVSDPAVALGELVAGYRAVVPPGLPRFFGGAVGYLGFDVARAWEDTAARSGPGARDDLGLDEARFVVSDTMVIFDNLRQTVKLLACALVDDVNDIDDSYDAAVRRVDELARTLARPASLRPLSLATEGPPDDVRSSVSRAQFLESVRVCQEHIRAGDAFQIVLSQRFTAPRRGADPFDVYRALRVINPSPYMYHLDLGDLAITGASPETLVRLDGRRIAVRPIAGTRRRGANALEDAALERELLADDKELAEHVMLIDLGRNDVGRVARVGSVRVEQTMAVERYSHVMHMVSLVTGHLADGKGPLDVLRATFPAGTLSGAPKIRAMQIIDALEPVRRGVYGGAVGYLSFPTGDGLEGANLDLAIAIRTLVTIGDEVHAQAGAGIVFDSVPESEYDETVNKARAALRALAIAQHAVHTGEEPK